MSYQTTEQVLSTLDDSALRRVLPLYLKVAHLRVRVNCAPPLRDVLADYFVDAASGPGQADATIDVLDGQTLEPAPKWVDWAREPGKTGRKDAIFDLQDGRLVYKVRTGVTFLQSSDRMVAFGPCSDHPNQVINFINTQILSTCQRLGWQICHASAVNKGERTLAIAGLSGGGKSTSVLRMMDIDDIAYVTNDRLLVRAAEPTPEALGIPKLPRINPGTIVHNPRLHSLMNETRRAQLADLPSEDLWQLEEKHDLTVNQIYGSERIRYDAPLTHFWVLNWQRDGNEPVQIVPVDLPERPDLLAAIMKGSGPFYQKPDGTFLSDDELPEPSGYLAALKGVEVFEVRGTVDFDALYRHGQALLRG